MNNLFVLTDQVAVVTGASSGLGVQLATALARQGTKLALLARRQEKLTQEAQKIKAETGVEIMTVETDVTQEEAVASAMKQIFEKYGRIDILVNNAGVAVGSPAEALPLTDWQKVIDTNLTGVYLCAKHAGQVMIKQRAGKIINLASIFGLVGNTAIPALAYHAAKGGVVNLTRALAAEWAKYKINVNAIGPGFFASEMTGPLYEDKNFNQYLKSRCPFKRWGETGELDGAVIFLASAASSFVTGQTLYVDGGWTAV